MNGERPTSIWTKLTTVCGVLALFGVGMCGVAISGFRAEMRELKSGVLRVILAADLKGTSMHDEWFSGPVKCEVDTSPLPGETPQQTAARHEALVNARKALAPEGE